MQRSNAWICSSAGRGPSSPTTRATTSSCAGSSARSSAPAPRPSGSTSGWRPTFLVAPVNSPKTIAADPQFLDRFRWIERDRLGADQLPTPLKFVGEELPTPDHAPTVGQHTDEVLADLLGWDEATIKETRARGGLGGPEG